MEFSDIWKVSFNKRGQEGDAPRVECNGCGKIVPGESVNPHLPEAGLEMDFQNAGYYGGFTDNEPWEQDKSKRRGTTKLCHDCVSNIMAVLPALAKSFGPGHHLSLTEDHPCCPHSWTDVKNADGTYTTMIPDQDGGWKVDPDPTAEYEEE